jgi:hypothetical protein
MSVQLHRPCKPDLSIQEPTMSIDSLGTAHVESQQRSPPVPPASKARNRKRDVTMGQRELCFQKHHCCCRS